MMWKTGAMLIKGKVYKYQVKVYEVGSEFGIDGGKISKAWISLDGKAVVNYDRGCIVARLSRPKSMNF